MDPHTVGGVVCMGDIEAAIQEVFQAPHIQVSEQWWPLTQTR